MPIANINTGVTSVSLVAANALRTGLVLCPPSEGTVWIAPAAVTVLGQGIPISAGDNVIFLSALLPAVGVQAAWSVIGSRSGVTVPVITFP